MDEKQKRLLELIAMTREKMSILIEKTKSLKISNYKLEALLRIIDKLSIPDIPVGINFELNNALNVNSRKVQIDSGEKAMKDISVLKNSDFFDTPFNETIPIIEHKEPNISETKWTYERILEKIANIKNNTLFIKNTHKVVSILNCNVDGLSIENIIKKTGVSKYRCIDIINELTKVTPQILLKRYENKSYIYYLNI